MYESAVVFTGVNTSEVVANIDARCWQSTSISTTEVDLDRVRWFKFARRLPCAIYVLECSKVFGPILVFERPFQSAGLVSGIIASVIRLLTLSTRGIKAICNGGSREMLQLLLHVRVHVGLNLPALDKC